MVINKGDKFIALVDFYMDSDVERKELKYKKGKVYLSEKDDCITNEQGNKSHCWTNIFYRGEPIFERYENVVSTITDEDCVNLEESAAMRFNNGKPQYSLLDLASLEDTVRVLEFGAQKYDRDNWKKGLQFSQILDSMMRHIKGLQSGEWLDSESGLPHIGHIGCNAMFLGSKTNIMDLESLQEEFKNWKDGGKI